MTLFEYLAVGYSLVLSFAAMRILEGLPHAARQDRRHWPHLFLVVSVLLICVTTFWLFWSFRTVEWDYPRFLLALANPGLIYVMACTLVPRNPDAIQSWGPYFESVRVRFFSVLGCRVLVTVAMTSLMLEWPLWDARRVPTLVSLAVAAAGALTSNSKAVYGISLFILLGNIFVTLALQQPGALAEP